MGSKHSKRQAPVEWHNPPRKPLPLPLPAHVVDAWSLGALGAWAPRDGRRPMPPWVLRMVLDYVPAPFHVFAPGASVACRAWHVAVVLQSARRPACAHDLRARARLGCWYTPRFRDPATEDVDPELARVDRLVADPLGEVRLAVDECLGAGDHVDQATVTTMLTRAHDFGAACAGRDKAVGLRSSAASVPEARGGSNDTRADVREGALSKASGGGDAGGGGGGGGSGSGKGGGSRGDGEPEAKDGCAHRPEDKDSPPPLDDGPRDEPETATHLHGDGHYALYLLGDAGRPVTLWVRGLESEEPACYLTLPMSLQEGRERANFSSFRAPLEWERADDPLVIGSDVVTFFARVRVNPVTLMVKTDDYTFSSSSGFATHQYWGGSRTLSLQRVPFGTARTCHPSEPAAGAAVDVRGTPFRIESEFVKMGHAAHGKVAWDDSRQRVTLSGGGWAGRVCPELDRTLGEQPRGRDSADEGRNGGWVLQLEWDPACAVGAATQGPGAKRLLGPGQR